MKRHLLVLVLVVLSLLTLAPVFGGDLTTVLGVHEMLPMASRSATVTPDPIEVDNYGAGLVVIGYASGSYSGTDGWMFQLLQCASSTGTFTAVAAGDVVGVTPDASGTIFTLDADQTTPGHEKIGYLGGYKWLKLKLLEVGTATVTPQIGLFIGGNPHLAPVDDD